MPSELKIQESDDLNDFEIALKCVGTAREKVIARKQVEGKREGPTEITF